MNFQEWYNKSEINSYNSDIEWAAELSWNRCKEEVLKITNKLNTQETRNNENGFHFHIINKEDIIKEIERL